MAIIGANKKDIERARKAAGVSGSASTEKVTEWRDRALLAAWRMEAALREWETSTIRDEVTAGDLLSITDALITCETKAATLRSLLTA